jgi:hypothetical protein
MTNPALFKNVIESPKDTQIGGSHYKDFKIQVSDYIYENNLNWYQGNCIKYISRYDRKNGDTSMQIQDLKKAIHYIQLLIEKIEKN